MGFFKNLFDKFVGREKLSDAARLIGRVFDDENTVGQSFFDTTMARFDNFDQQNEAMENRSFPDDVSFIIQCIAESLSSSQDVKYFSDHIDSYMYMYRRIEEYLAIIKGKSHWIMPSKSGFTDLNFKLMYQLSSVFADTRGLQPNLFTKDRGLLERMNMCHHLKSMTTIKETDMNLFFALCKLSLQSLSVIQGITDLSWKEILLNAKNFELSIQEFVARYMDCELAFGKFPLNIPAFISLIQKLRFAKRGNESPIRVFIHLAKSLSLNIDEFFNQFAPIFQTKLKEKFFELQHIGDLLTMLGRHVVFFNLYLEIYAASVDNSALWNVYLYLGKNSELNEGMQNHLISLLSSRMSNATIYAFQDYIKLAEKCASDLTAERRLGFLNIFGAVLNAFISKQLLDDSCAYRFSDPDLRGFFKIGLALSTTPQDGLQQPFAPLIIRRLLFQMTDRSSGVGEKLKSLFTKVNTFDRKLTEENDPQQIIKDEWLQEFLLAVPQDFQGKLTRSIYQNLCDLHGNNRWTMHIWHRITHQSLIKSKRDNPNEMLTKLNVWMETVNHDTYQAGDTLTIIFIGNLFEAVIFKHINSILALPKIDHIVDFIVQIRKEAVHTINPKHVDDFIDSAKKAIRNTMLLQSESVELQSIHHLTDFSCSQMLDLR